MNPEDHADWFQQAAKYASASTAALEAQVAAEWAQVAAEKQLARLVDSRSPVSRERAAAATFEAVREGKVSQGVAMPGRAPVSAGGYVVPKHTPTSSLRESGVNPVDGKGFRIIDGQRYIQGEHLRVDKTGRIERISRFGTNSDVATEIERALRGIEKNPDPRAAASKLLTQITNEITAFVRGLEDPE